MVACDYVGVESAKKVPDKFSKSGFHAAKSDFVNAPLIDELPMALECKVKSFEDGIRQRQCGRKHPDGWQDRSEEIEANQL